MPAYLPARGLTLVTGSKLYRTSHDRRKLYENAIGLDMQDGEGVDVVSDLEKPLPVGPFNHVDCYSTLEHVSRPWLAAANIQDAMNDQATIFFSAPFIWRRHGYPSDYYRYTCEGIRILFDRIEWEFLGYLDSENHYTEEPPKNKRKTYKFMLPRCEVVGFGVKV